MPTIVHAAFAFVGGVALATQVVINAALARGTGHVLTAAAISFGMGFASLLVGLLLFRVPVPRLGELGGLPWWAWTGGLLGAAYPNFRSLTPKTVFWRV